jgi:hypothetical protein
MRASAADSRPAARPATPRHTVRALPPHVLSGLRHRRQPRHVHPVPVRSTRSWRAAAIVLTYEPPDPGQPPVEHVTPDHGLLAAGRFQPRRVPTRGRQLQRMRQSDTRALGRLYFRLIRVCSRTFAHYYINTANTTPADLTTSVCLAACYWSDVAGLTRRNLALLLQVSHSSRRPTARRRLKSRSCALDCGIPSAARPHGSP